VSSGAHAVATGAEREGVRHQHCAVAEPRSRVVDCEHGVERGVAWSTDADPDQVGAGTRSMGEDLEAAVRLGLEPDAPDLDDCIGEWGSAGPTTSPANSNSVPPGTGCRVSTAGEASRTARSAGTAVVPAMSVSSSVAADLGPAGAMSVTPKVISCEVQESHLLRCHAS
jgi:hypothetical protein